MVLQVLHVLVAASTAISATTSVVVPTLSRRQTAKTASYTTKTTTQPSITNIMATPVASELFIIVFFSARYDVRSYGPSVSLRRVLWLYGAL